MIVKCKLIVDVESEFDDNISDIETVKYQLREDMLEDLKAWNFNKIEIADPNAFSVVVSSFEPQRYNIELVNDYNGEYADSVKDNDGEFVRYQDIKHLLAQH